MVDARGFVAPTFEQFRETVVDKWERTFGANGDTSSDTVDGLMIDIVTFFSTIHNEGVEQAYMSHQITTATGLNIDALLELFSTQRLAATTSKVQVFLYGDLATTIPSLSTMTTLDTGDGFELDSAVTIVADPRVIFTLGDATGINTTIDITIGGELTSVTFAFGGTANELRDGLLPQLNLNTKVVEVFSGGEQPNGDSIIYLRMDGILSHTITSSAGTPVDNFDTVEGLSAATVTGKIKANAGTLTRIGSPLTGWAGVTNIVAATLGSGEESDPAYKLRHKRVVFGLGRATFRALNAALNDQASVPGIESARVFMNTTNSVDALGRPPHSFESVVLGGIDADIVKTIYDNHTTGTQSYGFASAIIIDNREDPAIPREIFFTRATQKYMWVDVEAVKGEGFPSTSPGDLQVAVAQALSNFGQGLGISRDVYPSSELSGVVTSTVPGLTSVTVRIGFTPNSTDPKPPLTTANVTVSEREVSRWDPGRITAVFT